MNVGKRLIGIVLLALLLSGCTGFGDKVTPLCFRDCDGQTLKCTVDKDCDDNNICTTNTCSNGICSNAPANQGSPCDDHNVCTQDTTCQSDGTCGGGVPLDADQDGYVSVDCGGDDCDDNDPSVHPGQKEGPAGDHTCIDLKDNDCDGKTDADDPGCSACPWSHPNGLKILYSYQARSGLRDMAVADLDGDGAPEIVIIDAGNHMHILQIPTDGTDQLNDSSFISLMNSGSGIGIGQFITGGWQEILVGESVSGNPPSFGYEIFEHRTDTYQTGGFGPLDFCVSPPCMFMVSLTDVLVDDFNCDSYQDAAFRMLGGTNSNLLMAWGDGNGSLTSSALQDVISLGITTSSGKITKGSFKTSTENTPDIVAIASISTSPTVKSILYSCVGREEPLDNNCLAGKSPLAVGSGKFNDNVSTDSLVVAAQAPNNQSILMTFDSSGDGTYNSLGTQCPIENTVVALAIGDVSGDGRPDVVTASNGNNEIGVGVLFGNGNGVDCMFTIPFSTNALPNVTRTALADFDGDGVLELALLNTNGSADPAVVILKPSCQ